MNLINNENTVLIIKGIILLLGYIITFITTNFLIQSIILRDKDLNKDGKINESDTKIQHIGKIIGKCENIIIISFVLADAITGLALIFAAKNLVRKKDIEEKSEFFLVGTMVNFTASLIIAFILKFVLKYIDSFVG